MDYFKNDRYHAVGYTPTAVQRAAWQIMKDEFLNPLRVWVGMAITITDGIREEKQYYDLLNRGFFPSPRSDHFAGNLIRIPNQSPFSASTFALDMVIRTDMRKVCHAIYRHNETAVTIPGMRKGILDQLIMEEQVKDGKIIKWIHASLSPEAMYSPEIAVLIRAERGQKQKYLEMKDGVPTATRFA